MSIRDEQKEQRRWLIIMKAAELFARNGYADTKIGDIAKAANMSIGLLFHYFESKEKLYEELVRMGAEFSKKPQEININNPLDYFRMSIEGIFAIVREQPIVLYIFVIMGQTRRSETIPPHIREIALGIDQMEQSAEIIAAGQEYGYFREGDPNLLSFTFWSAVQGVMEQLAVTPAMEFPSVAWLIDIIKGDKND